ncbi:conserved hypothetical protein [Azorhizobium caulinodans ORS 571]|uniref:PE cleavage protein A C-terminal domain-containing protein n=1 Tax=Azorhizobium caulinodans (strain ATCC 43989 / DSM 5975 / JCM 20966 / LMG 6465 / NBRC 14845 / NCIMB 13405 / ORS 571) TaxID=438753 RepID=A8I9R0_AZOC5|nr:hypothetical protein [Azorhizobium caulinodans]BAF88819.1 conserved hypothetical protein [Azorhizobium caulinodans ORS 571]
MFRSRVIAAFVMASALFTGAGPFPARAADPSPVTLPYIDAPAGGTALNHVPHLMVSVGGGPARRAVLDTGSTGLVIAAKAIPDFEHLPRIGPRSITYRSSGRVVHGVMVLVPVTITGADGTSVTTTPIPVLATQWRDCLPHARRCVPARDLNEGAMIGIGYGHEATNAKVSGAAKNPFLHVAGMDAAGPLRPGYVVTRSAVTVGLPPTLPEGFSLVRLDRQRGNGDWSLPPACVRLDGAKPLCGPLSVDTGIPDMILTLPYAVRRRLAGPRGYLPPPNRIDVSVGRGAEPAAQYVFSIGARDSASPPGTDPRRVLLAAEPHPIRVNTGLRFLNAYDIIYDPVGGQAGYRPHPL